MSISCVMTLRETPFPCESGMEFLKSPTSEAGQEGEKDDIDCSNSFPFRIHQLIEMRERALSV